MKVFGTFLNEQVAKWCDHAVLGKLHGRDETYVAQETQNSHMVGSVNGVVVQNYRVSWGCVVVSGQNARTVTGDTNTLKYYLAN